MSRAPSSEQLGQAMLSLMQSTFKTMLSEPIIGSMSAQVNSYCVALQQVIGESSELVDSFCSFMTEQFYSMYEGQKALFPSAIKSSFHVRTNNALCSREFRHTLKCHLQGLRECEEKVLNCFIGDFVSTLCSKVIVFVFQKMRAGSDSQGPSRRKRSSDSVDSTDFKQTVYHIAGSVISGFLWKGKQYLNTSKTWHKYYNVLKEKCLRQDSGEDQCCDEVRHFSESKDRGGYKHVNDNTFSFFLSLFDLLMSVEGEDGSLPQNVINDTILGDDVILCLWDIIVGSDLNQEEALDLLIQICTASVKVVIKGIIKRRVNDNLKQAYNSVALRAKLASK